jgi:uncharacterized membrane protein
MKHLVLLFSLVVIQVLGNIWLSRGMRQVGGTTGVEPSGLLALGTQVLTNHWIILGIGFQIVCLALYLTAISRLDLSYVLPIMSSSYVLTTLFAWLILGEQIAATRWIGTLLVSMGVMLASLTDGRRSRIDHKR